jgi:hypothetical protein
MPLPELVRKLVDKKIGAYCRDRIPPHAQDEIRLSYAVRGNSVTISESRPVFTDPSQWVAIKIAQVRYDPGGGKWTLYCADRNSKWHEYSGLRSQRVLDKILKEMDRDPTGIFWG